jgi:Methyltransferase domain
MTGFTTDKVSPHGYLPDYLRLAADLGTAAVVCEVGVKAGESLVLWQHLFPHSPAIVGVDYDENATWPEGTVRLVASQDDPDLRDRVRAHLPGGTCDLIVDDASHKTTLTAAAFASLWPLVRPGGYYVVEDWADPWVDPSLPRWPPEEELVGYVPRLIEALKDGAQTVTYTWQGLAIIQRKP